MSKRILPFSKASRPSNAYRQALESVARWQPCLHEVHATGQVSAYVVAPSFFFPLDALRFFAGGHAVVSEKRQEAALEALTRIVDQLQ